MCTKIMQSVNQRISQLAKLDGILCLSCAEESTKFIMILTAQYTLVKLQPMSNNKQTCLQLYTVKITPFSMLTI